MTQGLIKKIRCALSNKANAKALTRYYGSNRTDEEFLNSLPQPGTAAYKRRMYQLDPLYRFYDTKLKKLAIVAVLSVGCYLAYLPLSDLLMDSARSIQRAESLHTLHGKHERYGELDHILKSRKNLNYQLGKLKENIGGVFSHVRFIPNVLLDHLDLFPHAFKEDHQTWLKVDRLDPCVSDKPLVNYALFMERLRAAPGDYFIVPPHYDLLDYLSNVLPEFPQNVHSVRHWPSFEILPILVNPKSNHLPNYLIYSHMKLKYTAKDDPILWIKYKEGDSEAAFMHRLFESLGMDTLAIEAFSDPLYDALNCTVKACQSVSDDIQSDFKRLILPFLNIAQFGPPPPYASPIKVFIELEMNPEKGSQKERLKWMHTFHQFSRQLMDSEIAQVFLVTDQPSFPLLWTAAMRHDPTGQKVAFYTLPPYSELHCAVNMAHDASFSLKNYAWRVLYHIHITLNYMTERLFMYHTALDFKHKPATSPTEVAKPIFDGVVVHQEMVNKWKHEKKSPIEVARLFLHDQEKPCRVDDGNAGPSWFSWLWRRIAPTTSANEASIDVKAPDDHIYHRGASYNCEQWLHLDAKSRDLLMRFIDANILQLGVCNKENGDFSFDIRWT